MDTRVCNRCNIEKPITMFWRNKPSKDGRLTICSSCWMEYQNKRPDIWKRKYSKFRFGGNLIKVLERDGYKCLKCGMTDKEHHKIYKRSITVDHIDGKGRNSKSPNNELSNLQTLCLICHGKKDGGKRP